MAVSTILSFQNINFTAIHTYDYFRIDNILFDICMYITLIGSLVILIKKHISRKIIQRIPKSNILAPPTNNQVRPNNEINTGDLFLLRQIYLHFLSFCLKKNSFWGVICHLLFFQYIGLQKETILFERGSTQLSQTHRIFTVIFLTSILIFIIFTGKAKINHLYLGDKRNNSECNLQPFSLIQTKQFKI